MGPEYGQRSALLLKVLIIPVTFSLANSVAIGMAFGTEKRKPIAIYAIGEGLANLILSILLGKAYGPIGVAFGTLIPSLWVQVIIWPGYVSKLVSVSRRELMLNVWVPMAAASIPFVFATALLEQYSKPGSTITFFGETAAILPIFGACAFYVMRGEVLPRIREHLNARKASA
jgi:O-antigen/teichoic acid export membrane protein